MNFALKPEVETNHKMFSLFNNKTRETDILQKYYSAIKTAEENNETEAKINSFNDVLDFCSNDLECLNDDSRKRDMVIYWTYVNIGDIFMEQMEKDNSSSNYENAQKNYQHALNFSRNTAERTSVLKKLAKLYEKKGDKANFYTIKNALVETLPVEARREAFEKLADATEDDDKKIYFLEKALDFIKYEKIPALYQCKNTIKICEKLKILYLEKEDFANLARIEELRVNTSYLIH